MIARALHALARGLDAAGDYLEHAASPPVETLRRAQVSTRGYSGDRPASEMGPPARIPSSFPRPIQGVPHADGDDAEAWGFLRRNGALAGITPAAGVTLAVVDLERAAQALREHAPIVNRPDGPISGCSCHGIRWGDSWSEHAVTELFDALPTVQGRTDARPAGWVRRPGLEDTDPELIERLREAGDRWGPLGVAIVAAALTDPNVLIAHLRSHAPTRVVPQYDDETEGEKTTDEPTPGWMTVQAGQLTEFLGRTIILPGEREHVPHHSVVLQSARFEYHTDGNTSPDAVLVTLEGHEQPYMLMPSDQVQVKTR